MKFKPSLHLATIASALALVSCGDSPSSHTPVVVTPAGAKVNLTKVSMTVGNVQFIPKGANQYSLSFDYTVDNQSGSHISFLCLHNNTDDLIEVNLSDNDGEPLHLGKRPLEGLTLTEPRPLRLPVGKTTRSFSVPVMPGLREKGDVISVRVRLHAPSRYDELRSSVEAPRIQIPWPQPASEPTPES